MYPYFTPCMNPMFAKDDEPMHCANMPNLKLTRAYIPSQPYIGIFPLNEALKKGTLFPNLYIPYPIKSME